jgi:hypothetical protein
MNAYDSRDPLSPAERRLGEHLALLRDVSESPPPTLTRRIVHAARWQRTLREPIVAIANLAAAVGEGIRMLIGRPLR